MRAFQRPTSEPRNALTPRQQQVLGLLAAGRTNPEIAETLGVTLAGAKWHVSEVISRLGVTSREEAAECWREQNRLPSRFSRAVRGLFGAGLLKTVAAGAAAVTLGGGVVVAAMVYTGGDGDAVQTPPGPIFSEAQAGEHAVYVAGEYLKQTDIPQTVEVDGHPISVADMLLIELLYIPKDRTPMLTTVRDRWYSGVNQSSWMAVLRRENVRLPGVDWTDGRMTVTVLFEDGSGEVHSAVAGGSSKQMDEAPQPPTVPPRDPALAERASDFFPVMRLDSGNLHTTFNVYQTRGGEWCWAERSDDGSATTSCGLDPTVGSSSDVFGFGLAGPRTRTASQAMTPGHVHGALSARVDHVLLEFENGDPVAVAATDFPAATGLPWRAFASMLDPGRGGLLAVHAIGQDGTELSQLTLKKETKVPPYIVQPLDSIDFSGSGDGLGGEFRLPRPAFPVSIALIATHDGAGPITADVVCDTGTNRILDAVGPVGGANGSLVVLLSPGATRCSFVVHADGAWRFLTK